jgi:hypothetical protein
LALDFLYKRSIFSGIFCVHMLFKISVAEPLGAAGLARSQHLLYERQIVRGPELVASLLVA